MTDNLYRELIIRMIQEDELRHKIDSEIIKLRLKRLAEIDSLYDNFAHGTNDET